eukprot:GHVN01084359.1.p1 GENE.GHVN01084359.1~~GHVN01084359.1.p1  ORF type:complete len:454 (+),score=164.56 GHVN01084359.1:278-1639(+)
MMLSSPQSRHSSPHPSPHSSPHSSPHLSPQPSPHLPQMEIRLLIFVDSLESLIHETVKVIFMGVVMIIKFVFSPLALSRQLISLLSETSGEVSEVSENTTTAQMGEGQSVFQTKNVLKKILDRAAQLSHLIRPTQKVWGALSQLSQLGVSYIAWRFTQTDNSPDLPKSQPNLRDVMPAQSITSRPTTTDTSLTTPHSPSPQFNRSTDRGARGGVRATVRFGDVMSELGDLSQVEGAKKKDETKLTPVSGLQAAMEAAGANLNRVSDVRNQSQATIATRGVSQVSEVSEVSDVGKPKDVLNGRDITSLSRGEVKGTGTGEVKSTGTESPLSSSDGSSHPLPTSMNIMRVGTLPELKLKQMQEEALKPSVYERLNNVKKTMTILEAVKPKEGFEDVYACDEDPETGKLKPIRIQVFPEGILRVYHIEMTYLIIISLILSAFISAGYELYLVYIQR